MGLTARQQAFVDAYAGNATEAAIKAGYSPKTAYSKGQQLKKVETIAQAIREREENRRNELIGTREERMMILTATYRDENAPLKERLKAVDIHNKSNHHPVQAARPAAGYPQAHGRAAVLRRGGAPAAWEDGLHGKSAH